MVRRSIVSAVVFLLSLGIVPLARHFMSSTPEWFWRVAAVSAGLGIVTAAGLVPFYSWLSNPTEHPIGSTLFITLSSASIATLCWILFALKIGAPDFTASVFACDYNPYSLTFSASVAYINSGPSDRTVVGATWRFREAGEAQRMAGYASSPPTMDLSKVRFLTPDPTQYVHIKAGTTEVTHYEQIIELWAFNGIALRSGKGKGDAEAGLEITSLTTEAVQQKKAVFFMNIYVAEGVCELRSFGPTKISLDATGN